MIHDGSNKTKVICTANPQYKIGQEVIVNIDAFHSVTGCVVDIVIKPNNQSYVVDEEDKVNGMEDDDDMENQLHDYELYHNDDAHYGCHLVHHCYVKRLRRKDGSRPGLFEFLMNCEYFLWYPKRNKLHNGEKYVNHFLPFPQAFMLHFFHSANVFQRKIMGYSSHIWIHTQSNSGIVGMVWKTTKMMTFLVFIGHQDKKWKCCRKKSMMLGG